MIVPTAQTAVATVEELSEHGHSDVLVKDMDGNGVELEVLKAIVDMEANPSPQARATLDSRSRDLTDAFKARAYLALAFMATIALVFVALVALDRALG